MSTNKTKTTTDAHRQSRALISIRRVACCIGCVLSVPCSSFADAIPVATYTITVAVGTTGSPQVTSNTIVPNTVAGVNSTGSLDGAQFEGLATAQSFMPLTVLVEGEVDKLAAGAPVTTFTEGASISYYFQVEQTAPAPVSIIPLLVHGHLQANAGGNLAAGGEGAADATAALSIPALNISPTVSAFCNRISCASSSSMSFSFNGSANVMAGQNILVQLLVAGDAGAIPGLNVGSSTFFAFADPEIEIDPSFAFANDFTLAFSPNLTPPIATPEPSSIALLATGLLALMAGLRSNGVRRRF